MKSLKPYKVLRQIIVLIFFPFGNHYSKGCSHLKWSGDKAPFRPEGPGDWAFVISQLALLVCWLDHFIASAPWELGLIQNGIIILQIYLGLMFFSYPIRILYMRPNALPHKFFGKDEKLYPFSKRWNFVTNLKEAGNLPILIYILGFFPIWIWRPFEYFNWAPSLLAASEGETNTLMVPLKHLYYFSSNSMYVVRYNTLVILVIYVYYLIKSRKFWWSNWWAR